MCCWRLFYDRWCLSIFGAFSTFGTCSMMPLAAPYVLLYSYKPLAPLYVIGGFTMVPLGLFLPWLFYMLLYSCMPLAALYFIGDSSCYWRLSIWCHWALLAMALFYVMYSYMPLAALLCYRGLIYIMPLGLFLPWLFLPWAPCPGLPALGSLPLGLTIGPCHGYLIPGAANCLNSRTTISHRVSLHKSFLL